MEHKTTFKAFNKDFTCREYQFKVGEIYKIDGPVKVCDNGFHSCENPLDCLSYYDLIDSRFAVIENIGEIETHEDDSKIACAEIRIKAELTLPEFIKNAVNWMIDHCTSNTEEASGDYAQLAASGDYAQLAAGGDYAQLAASGDYAQLAASGDSAKLAASGYSAQLAASGDYAKLAAGGDYAQLAAEGEDSVIASSSRGGIAKGVNGTHIAIASYDDDGKCQGFAVGVVGENGIKENVFYLAENCEFVEAYQ